MSKAKSSYTYTIEDHLGRKWIVIQDQNLGRMSVTNDIENVVNDICQVENITTEEHLIIYQDSESEWTGYNLELDKFIFAANSRAPWQQVAEEILQQIS